MKMCDDGHEEVVFETLTGECPMCLLADDHEKEMSELENGKQAEISDLEEDLSELNLKLEAKESEEP